MSEDALTSPLDLEQHLMLRFQRGDEHAFEQLYGRIRDPVHRYAWRMLGEAQAAEEATQEILLRVYRARHRYRPTARFRTWLYRIATNYCLNERDRAWRRHESLTSDGAELQAVGAVALDTRARTDAMALQRAFQAALAQLPERQRAAVVLARWEGFTMKELAESLEISVGAAKVLLHRARARLEELLRPHLSTRASS